MSFAYTEEKLNPLSQKVKAAVDDKTKDIDWSKKTDIKAELMLLRFALQGILQRVVGFFGQRT